MNLKFTNIVGDSIQINFESEEYFQQISASSSIEVYSIDYVQLWFQENTKDSLNNQQFEIKLKI